MTKDKVDYFSRKNFKRFLFSKILVALTDVNRDNLQIELKKKMTKESPKPRLDTISRSPGNRGKLPVTSKNPSNSAKCTVSMTSHATLNSISGRSADCINLRFPSFFLALSDCYLDINWSSIPLV